MLDDEALVLSLDEDATVKTTNGKGGKRTMIKAGCCVRTFGPYRIIYNEAGHIVKVSKKGHPLGDHRPLFLPYQLLEHVPVVDVKCEIARYKACAENTACVVGRPMINGELISVTCPLRSFVAYGLTVRWSGVRFV